MSRVADFVARAWGRKLTRVAVRIVVVLIALRMLLSLALPLVIGHLASRRGLACSYASLSLSTFSGECELRGLTLSDPASGPLFSVDYAYADIDMLATLGGDPSVDRVEVDGVGIVAEIERDGGSAWRRLFEQGSADVDPNSALAQEAGALDFSSPVRAREVRAHHVVVTYIDRAVTP